jgi:hypothetical protein
MTEYCMFNPSFSGLFPRRLPASRRASQVTRRARRFASRLDVEFLETRLTLTGNIAITGAILLGGNGQPVSDPAAGQGVYVEAEFTTSNLPSGASYRVAYNFDGLTIDSGYISDGAGDSATASSSYESAEFIPSPGTNQVTVTVDPDDSVAESSYTDNTISFTFTATSPAVGNLSYSVSQIRAAYGINNIPNFGSVPADGTGQTIAIVDLCNDPNILGDLDGFDQAMQLTPTSTESLYQQYGSASSILTVYNQYGGDITSQIANSGAGAVPPVDSSGGWEVEESLDVEWAHAIAPGAHIDLIECSGVGNAGGAFAGVATARDLPGVTAVSMSWGLSETDLFGAAQSELGYDSSTFATDNGHPGVTFLASTGDGGNPGEYPAFSPNVVAVGATQLTMNGNTYGGETAWSFATPRTLNNGSSSYSQTGPWTSQSSGFSGTYSTAAAGSDSSATWTTSISSSDQGYTGGTEVSATWVPSASNATNATYEIYDGSAAAGTLLGTVTVDQTKAPVGTSDGGTQFQELGVYDPQSGTLTVVLNAGSANGAVVADAVGIAQAWATGGGQSMYEPEPTYQLPVQNTGYRTTPDVSFDGSVSSGVTFYEGGIRYDIAGTSLSSPCWAGLIAIANQGRLAAGGASFNSPANPMQALDAIYSLPASDFNEITSGYNGLSAGPGYNEVTGLGSPVADLLVPDLASYELPTQLEITAQPSASVTAGSAFGLMVAAEDRLGNVIKGYSGSVTISLATEPGDGALNGTLSVKVVDGVASFSGLTLDAAGSGYSIQATAGNLASATTNSFNVNAAAATKLIVTAQPQSSVTAGAGFGFTVAAEDRFGNVATSFDGNVTVALNGNPGQSTLGGTTTVMANNGLATFSGMTLNKSGNGYTLQATSTGLSSATTNAFGVTAALASQLVIAVQPPASVTAGMAFDLTISAEDPFGNLATSFVGPVTVAVASGPGTLSGAVTASAGSGVANFTDLVSTTSGSITLAPMATAGGDNLSSPQSQPILVNPAAAAQLVIAMEPSSTAIAGQAFLVQPVVKEEDQYGNVVTSDNSSTVTADIGSLGTTTLQGTDLTARVVNGVASFFGLSYDKAESLNLIFSSSKGAVAPTTSTTIAVSPAQASQLVIVQQPSGQATAGQPLSNQPVIDEEDQFGNLVAGDSSTMVTVSLDSGTGPLQGTTSETLSGGVATFANLADDLAETITLGVSGGGLSVGPSHSIAVGPGPSAGLVIRTQPSPGATAGVAFATQPVIDEVDQFGNLETGDSSTVVTASPSSGNGLLQGTTSAILNDGVATFSNLAEDTAGPISLGFSGGGFSAGPSTSVAISPGSSYGLMIHTEPSPTATAGVALAVGPVIDEVDQFGNLETGDNSTVVTASLASGGGPLQGTTTAIMKGGVGTFTNLVDDAAGTITLGVSGGAFRVGPSTDVTINPGPAYALVIHTQPSPAATAGAALAVQPVIDEVDRFGNLETGDNSTMVTASLDSGNGPIQGTTTATLTGGVATFSNLADDAAETITLGFSAGGLSVGPSSDITISPGPAHSLMIHTQPSPAATAGVAFVTQPVIYEVDEFGNLETADSKNVITASLGSGGGPLKGTAAATLKNGVATFGNLADDLAETIALDFSGGGLRIGPSTNVAIGPGPIYDLLIHTQPSPAATAGVAFATQPVLFELDQFGNLETGDDSSIVTASLASGNGPIHGTATAMVDEGVASFSGLADDLAETIALEFKTGGIASMHSTPINVVAAPASRLVIASQPPGSITAGKGFAFQVEAEDNFGNVDHSFDGPVTGALMTNPGGSNLSGGRTITASSGIADFSGLALNKAGNGYTLQVSSGSLAPATTGDFNVDPIPTAIAQVLLKQHLNKKGKPQGAPVFTGFSLQYSTAMNPHTAGLQRNYQVYAFNTKGRLMPVALRETFNSANKTVILTISGKSNPFAKGGVIDIMAKGFTGVSSQQGVLLSPSYTSFKIAAKAKSISLA